jgi:hypothetical protein
MRAALEGDIANAVLGALGSGLVLGAVMVLDLVRFIPSCLIVLFFLGFLAAVALLVTSLYSAYTHMVDLRRGTYIRVIGPIYAYYDDHVSDEDGSHSYSYYFTADGKRFTLSADTYDRISLVSWGTLEYTPRSRTILSLSTQAGDMILGHGQTTGVARR